MQSLLEKFFFVVPVLCAIAFVSAWAVAMFTFFRFKSHHFRNGRVSTASTMLSTIWPASLTSEGQKLRSRIINSFLVAIAAFIVVLVNGYALSRWGA